MHVFVTGATGWVGSAVVEELHAAGHRVTGLARSDAAAAALDAAGIAVLRGSLEDTDSLQRGARAADAVIHLAFNHDFSRFADNIAAENAALDAVGTALAGSGKPLIVSSGIAVIAPGRRVTEADAHDPASGFPRNPEAGADKAAQRGARVSIVRLPPSTHGPGETHGFVPILIRTARERGFSAYVGDGTNHWCAVHRRDAARVYAAALERGAERAVYHAVADEGVPVRAIAELIARRLDVPAQSIAPADAEAHFGFFSHFAQIDAVASSAETRRILTWTPREAGLLTDLEGDAYFSPGSVREGQPASR